MWFVYLKILYDSSPVVKVLFWAFILYVSVMTAYDLYGWWGILGLVGIILTIIIDIWWSIRHRK